MHPGDCHRPLTCLDVDGFTDILDARVKLLVGEELLMGRVKGKRGIAAGWLPGAGSMAAVGGAAARPLAV